MQSVSRRQLFLGAAALGGFDVITPRPVARAAAAETQLYAVHAVFVRWRPQLALAEFFCLDAELENRQYKTYRRCVRRYARVPYCSSGDSEVNHICPLERVTLLGPRPPQLEALDCWYVNVIVNARGRRLEFLTALRRRSAGVAAAS